MGPTCVPTCLAVVVPQLSQGRIQRAQRFAMVVGLNLHEMDKVVGICVLLGGKVVQVSQVLVLGDRERRADTSQVEAKGKLRLRAVSDMPKLYVQDPSQLSAKICIWGQLTGNLSNSRGAFTASSPSFHVYILFSTVPCVMHHSFIHDSFIHSLTNTPRPQ